MIQNRSFLKLADNSGAKLVQCIKVCQSKKVVLGSLILVAVKQIRSESKLKKGELYKAVIVRLSNLVSRQNGFHIRCSENAVVLLSSKNEIHGTRLSGPVANELRKKKFAKMLSLAKFVV